jgi:hypothetical protein
MTVCGWIHHQVAHGARGVAAHDAWPISGAENRGMREIDPVMAQHEGEEGDDQQHRRAQEHHLQSRPLHG